MLNLPVASDRIRDLRLSKGKTNLPIPRKQSLCAGEERGLPENMDMIQFF